MSIGYRNKFSIRRIKSSQCRRGRKLNVYLSGFVSRCQSDLDAALTICVVLQQPFQEAIADPGLPGFGQIVSNRKGQNLAGC